MLISSSKELGELVKKERKSQKLTQLQLAAASGVGVRFIVDLENGKPTTQIDKAFFVVSMLGLGIDIDKIGAKKISGNLRILPNMSIVSGNEGKEEEK